MAIGFIGAGNMAGALVRALVSRGVVCGSDILVINKKNTERLKELASECGAGLVESIEEMAARCSTLVLATKPPDVGAVADKLSGRLTGDKLLISVVAGVTIKHLESRVAAQAQVIRAMPNTPVQVGEGATALCSGASVTDRSRELALRIFGSVGKTFWVDESAMDVITALSGSGPAYFYRLAEDMAKAAHKLGLEETLARELARQTLVGSGKLLHESEKSPAELLRQVVSPNGTTAAALRVFDNKLMNALVQEAMTRAAARSEELSGAAERRLLSKAHRIVVKVGTPTVAGPDGALNEESMARIVSQIARLQAEGREVLLVSSGAIACGRARMSQADSGSITEQQVLSAIGQGLLMRMYESLFDHHNITVAQILLTKEDLSNTKRSSLCRATLDELLVRGVVPVINENDAVAVDEIRLGDNDTLSAEVAALVAADLLVLLTGTDGLYDKDPRVAPNARLLTNVMDMTPSMFGPASQMGGVSGEAATKLWAASLATENGIPTVIANGSSQDILFRILAGEEVGTFFSTGHHG